ncbi:hypothetical protein IFR05_014153 [Cadophora sp. M221]|nr:hypothetical protein IFR05_014153 [Cadophora sp. M221]
MPPTASSLRPMATTKTSWENILEYLQLPVATPATEKFAGYTANDWVSILMYTIMVPMFLAWVCFLYGKLNTYRNMFRKLVDLEPTERDRKLFQFSVKEYFVDWDTRLVMQRWLKNSEEAHKVSECKSDPLLGKRHSNGCEIQDVLAWSFDSPRGGKR